MFLCVVCVLMIMTYVLYCMVANDGSVLYVHPFFVLVRVRGKTKGGVSNVIFFLFFSFLSLCCWTPHSRRGCFELRSGGGGFFREVSLSLVASSALVAGAFHSDG